VSIQRAVISAVGEDRPGIVNDLTALIRELELNIDDSRMTVLGGEFAVLMSVAGEAEAIAALKPRLAALCQELGLAHLFRPTTERSAATQGLPYQVRVTAMDHPGIVQRIAGFFSARAINIEDLHTETQHAAHTGTPIFNLEMRIHVPAGTGTRALRQEFEEFCDERDLDGSLDPAL
jgi:glycine cleavage system transcriptional repressor